MTIEIASLLEKTIGGKSVEGRGGLTFLEQLTAKRGICSALGVPFVYKTDHQNKKAVFAKGRCKKWDCPECAVDNTRKWIARIIDGVNRLGAKEWYFATITAHKKWRKSYSLRNLRQNWTKLRKRLARATKKRGEELYYVRVWEKHKDGSYHMHLITNAPVTTRWLKDNAAQCGLGYQAKIDKAVNAGQCAGYIAKYMLKQWQGDIYKFPKGARRIEVSRNWVSWHEKDNDDFWQLAGTLEQAIGIVNFLKEHRGYEVEYLSVRKEQRKNEDATHTD